MKYSDLVTIKKALDEHDLNISTDVVEGQLKGMVECVTEKYTGKKNKVLKDILGNQYEVVKNGFATLKFIVDKIKIDLDKSIEDEKDLLLSRSHQCYQSELTKTTEEILDLHRSYVHYETSRFPAIVAKYGSWKHAAFIIHPGRESFVDSMIDNDPLYLVDQKHELLEPAISRFNEVYQRRLRKYIIDENVKAGMLDQLPDGQFGLCVVYHYFNFRPFEMIQRYLTEIYTKLKPGGVLIFTYNNCETLPGVMMVEAGKRCYATEYLISKEIHKIGYEFIHSEEYDAIRGPGTWVEIKKPGELTSIRGSQTLAKILPK
jgi:SAM-dependent methyltransferase